ncbi:MAG TPA: hypothetical protein VFX46_02420 [Hyphomicrobiaceae bacterium]|nr:hypothetical protein [Hyphomicrobiaceae bacterium]
MSILLAIVIVLGLLWYVFGGQTAPTTTATPGEGIKIDPTPPPTTPIVPRAPE